MIDCFHLRGSELKLHFECGERGSDGGQHTVSGVFVIVSDIYVCVSEEVGVRGGGWEESERERRRGREGKRKKGIVKERKSGG